MTESFTRGARRRSGTHHNLHPLWESWPWFVRVAVRPSGDSAVESDHNKPRPDIKTGLSRPGSRVSQGTSFSGKLHITITTTKTTTTIQFKAHALHLRRSIRVTVTRMGFYPLNRTAAQQAVTVSERRNQFASLTCGAHVKGAGIFIRSVTQRDVQRSKAQGMRP